jgi:hypothetical protein
MKPKLPPKELVVKVLLDRSNQIMNGARVREENEAIEKAKEAKTVHQDGDEYLLICSKCGRSIGWSKQVVEIICDSCKVKTHCTICKKEMPPSTWPWCRNCCEDPGY